MMMKNTFLFGELEQGFLEPYLMPVSHSMYCVCEREKNQPSHIPKALEGQRRNCRMKTTEPA